MNLPTTPNLPTAPNDGLAELTHGADDTRKYEIIDILKPENQNIRDSIFSGVSKDNDGNGGIYDIINLGAYSLGYVLFRYLAKQASKYATKESPIKTDPSHTKYFYDEDPDIVDVPYYVNGVNCVAADASARTKGIYITGHQYNTAIIGGNGDDTLRPHTAMGQYATSLYGGVGKDVFYCDQIYGPTDTILDYTPGEDIINIGTSSGQNNRIASYSIDGSDVILNIRLHMIVDLGSYTLIVKNAAGKAITFENGSERWTRTFGEATVSALATENNINETALISADIARTHSNLANYAPEALSETTNEPDSGSDIDDSLNATIDSGDGTDNIINYAHNVSINGGMGDDYIHNNGDKTTILCGDGNDSVDNHSSNVSISGGKGNDTVRNFGENIVFKYASDDGNDSIIGFNGTSTLQIGDGMESYSKNIDGSDVIVTVGNGKITLIGAAVLETLNIDGKDATVLTFTDSDAAKVTLKSAIKTVDATARTKAIRIVGNTLDNSIFGGTSKDTLYGGNGADYLAGGKGNDKLYGQAGNDTLDGNIGNDYLSGYTGNDSLNGGAGNDTLLGGTGNDTLTGGSGNDLFIYSAGKDVITDYATGDKISISADVTASSVKGSDATFTIGSNTLTVKNGKGKEFVFISAQSTERTIVGGAYLSTDSMKSSATISSWRQVGDASERTMAIKLTGNALDNTLLGGSGKDTLYGKDGNDYLSGNAGADKLYGQNGNDTLWGGTGNDTLTGGAGADLFIYSSGKDVITDYANGDKISLGAAIASASLNGANSFLKLSNGSTLTVKNAKELTLIDTGGTEQTTIIGSVILDDTASATTLESDIEVADASTRTKAIKIVGNTLANSILGGGGNDKLYGGKGDDSLIGNKGNDNLYGQDGNDTLWGGSGNDTLTGGNGADVFIYNNGEGKDVITDFSNDDLLQITGTFSTVFNSSSNTIAFKVGSTASAVTLKDYTATSFNVNGDSYLINGSKLVKK